MLPNFSMSGLVGVEHITQHFRELQIGDVIICMSPSVPGRAVLKRVIGMVTNIYILA
jgi:inner membrane protease subunit 1